VNRFRSLQWAFRTDCRKANGPPDSAPRGGIDTPLTDAYIFCWPLLMSSTPFGEHLKREREMRGVSLEEIAAATRISTRFLEAIEKEQWDQLPGGVFNRGFIRSIARFLGLDEDSLIAEYALGTKDGAETRLAPELPTEMPRNWWPAVYATIAILAIALVIAGGLIVYRHYGANVAERLRGQSPAGDATAHVNGPVIMPGATSQIAGPGESPAASPPAATPVEGEPTVPAAAALMLKMEVGRPANVTVVADGKPVFEGPVHPNDVKQFEAHDAFQITSSESSALLLELNGQTMAPIGTPGQPGSITLTRNDLKPAVGGPH
jgi:cytoskeletal protein RodZ